MLHVTAAKEIQHKSLSFDGATSALDYGSLDDTFHTQKCTTLALFRGTGSGENGFSYIIAKTGTSNLLGYRMYVDHNAGSPQLAFGVSNSNSSSTPLRKAAVGYMSYNEWTWLAASYDGSVNASGIELYCGTSALRRVDSFATNTNGTGTVVTNSGNSLLIGNRAGTDRTTLGDIALIARWNSVLTKEEINLAIRNGPRTVQPGKLVLLWAGGKDYGPRQIVPNSVTGISYARSRVYVLDTLPRLYFPVDVAGGAQTLTPSGIASAEAFGSHAVVPGAVSISATGIASLEAFGTHAVTPGAVTITASGIVSGEAFGSHTLTPGAVTILCSGIASAEAFGDAIVSAGGSIVSPSGIVSAEAFGSHTLTPGSVNVSPSAIASAEAFGATIVSIGAQFITPGAIGTGEAFGSATLTVGGVTILCSGIASAEAFGSAVLAGGAIVVYTPGATWSVREDRAFTPYEKRRLRLQ